MIRLPVSPARPAPGRLLVASLLVALLLVAGGTGPIGPAAAQDGGIAAPPPAAELVRLTAPAPLTARPGGQVEVRIAFEVLPGWHINAHRPNEDFLIASELTLAEAPGVVAREPRYPAAHQVTLSFSETPLAVYEGKDAIVVPMGIAADAAPGERVLTGRLRFQACNDQVCLPPATVPVRVTLRVAAADDAAGAPADAATPAPAGDAAVPAADSIAASDTASAPALPVAGFETGPPADGGAGAATAATAAAGNLVGGWFAERGSLLAFLLIFVMGLLLNLTPCVYPMLGVTVSLFGGAAAGAGATRGGALASLPRAVAYVLGICFMYSSLGVAAALTGSMFGAWLANPWVLGVIGLFLLAMALAMFGVYEMQVPSGVLSRLGGATGASFVGTFLAGLLVGVFAAPCIGAPVLALVAYVGAKGDPVFGFQAFFVLSLGLGLPYLVLAVFSGLLARLPRSGSWMDWVKHGFGVVLLGVAAFYLTLAVAPGRIGWVVPAALGLGGLYLGFLEPTGRDRAGFRRFKWAVGVAGIVAATLLVFRAPPPAVEWQPFSEAALAEASAAGRPVLLDFSAEWCVPCHELDAATFTDPEVVRATAGFTRLKVDLTRFDAPESQALRTRFAVAGVPTLVFLAPDGREVEAARSVGFVDAGRFLEHVERARGAATPAGR